MAVPAHPDAVRAGRWKLERLEFVEPIGAHAVRLSPAARETRTDLQILAEIRSPPGADTAAREEEMLRGALGLSFAHCYAFRATLAADRWPGPF